MAFFACGTRDKPYIRPLRSGTFLYRYSFRAGLASTTSSKVNKPASNFRRSLAERKVSVRSFAPHIWDGSSSGAGRTPAAIYELYREFRTNRRPLNVASVVSRTVRAGKFIYGGRRPPRPRGASLKQKLSFGKVRGQWRFIPRNSKKSKIHYKFALTLGN